MTMKKLHVKSERLKIAFNMDATLNKRLEKAAAMSGCTLEEVMLFFLEKGVRHRDKALSRLQTESQEV